MHLVLPACAAATQFSKLIPREDGDSLPLKTLEGYMKKKRQVWPGIPRQCAIELTPIQFSFATAYLDEDAVGLFFIFPAALQDLCELFRLPDNLRTGQGFVVALCPWKLTSGELKKFDWVSTEDRLKWGWDQPEYQGAISAMEDKHRARSTTNILYQRGLRILNFPIRLHSYLCKPNMWYCLWYGQTPTSVTPDVETAHLQAILDACGAENRGHKKDVKAIFIHLGHLATMGTVGAMSARRSKRPEIRFFTYGTHASVHPSRWGIREVYPIGMWILHISYL